MTITKDGIVYESCENGQSTHYYHASEGQVFPNTAYSRLHNGHCVLPVKVVGTS